MRLSDIPEVEAIERVSFPSPWSRRAYEYDLTRNPLARYIVVREERGEAKAPKEVVELAAVEPPRHLRERLLQYLGRLFMGWNSAPQAQVAAPSAPRGPVVGFAGMWLAMNEGHIVTIAVKPDYRRRGLGELLLVSLIDLACQAQASSLYLEVRVSNTAAKRLYEKYGFVVSRLRKGYYSDTGEDAWEMTLDGITTASYQARLQRLREALGQKLAAMETAAAALSLSGG